MAVGFPDEVEREAEAAAAARPSGEGRTDLTGVEFVTIDPPGSMDLDQAMHLERRRRRLPRALRDRRRRPPSCRPGSAARAGGVAAAASTVYCPDVRAPLYPTVAVRGRGQPPARTRRGRRSCSRSSWTPRGERRSARVERATVRSRHKLAYGDGSIPCLEQIGTLRRALARRRGARSAWRRRPRRSWPTRASPLRLPAGAGAAVAGRGLERRDLAAGGHDGSRPDGRRAA